MTQQLEAMKQMAELLAVATFHSPELQAKRTTVLNAGLKAIEQAQKQEPVAYIRKDQLQKATQSPLLCEVSPEPRQDRIGIWTSLLQRQQAEQEPTECGHESCDCRGYCKKQRQPEQEPVAWPNWKWMTHPSRNSGQPIPVQIYQDGGVTYYRPFDTDATEFELDEKDEDWCEVTSPPPRQPELNRVDVACDIKTLCVIGEIPSNMECIADWVASGEMPQSLPLTDEQIREIWVEYGCEGEDAEGFARAIEQAHGIGKDGK